MTKNTTKARQTSQRNAKKQGPPWLWIGLGAAALVALGILIYSATATRSQPAAPAETIAGVKVYPGLARDHVTGPVTYPQTPPVGGPHAAIWQNCGIYNAPVQNETAVHSLEHGAVWLTYQPTLPADQIELLKQLVRGHRYALLSPYDGLPSPVVASAWGVQLPVESASDPRLAEFIRTYEQGPQTPEPGAACSGGVGAPTG